MFNQLNLLNIDIYKLILILISLLKFIIKIYNSIE